MSKISDKTDKFLLNYSCSFWGPLFIGTQCIIIIVMLIVMVRVVVVIIIIIQEIF